MHLNVCQQLLVNGFLIHLFAVVQANVLHLLTNALNQIQIVLIQIKLEQQLVFIVLKLHNVFSNHLIVYPQIVDVLLLSPVCVLKPEIVPRRPKNVILLMNLIPILLLELDNVKVLDRLLVLQEIWSFVLLV